MIDFKILDLENLDKTALNYIKGKIVYQDILSSLDYLLDGGATFHGWEYDPIIANQLMKDAKLFLALAYADYKIVGCLYGHDSGLQFIYVEPEHRRQGIGTQLLKMFEDSLDPYTDKLAFQNGRIRSVIFNGDPVFINFFYGFVTR